MPCQSSAHPIQAHCMRAHHFTTGFSLANDGRLATSVALSLLQWLRTHNCSDALQACEINSAIKQAAPVGRHASLKSWLAGCAEDQALTAKRWGGMLDKNIFCVKFDSFSMGSAACGFSGLRVLRATSKHMKFQTCSWHLGPGTLHWRPCQSSPT